MYKNKQSCVYWASDLLMTFDPQLGLYFWELKLLVGAK